MKKLYFLSCICSFLLLVVSPTFIRHQLLADQSTSDTIRGDTSTDLRDQTKIDAQKEKERNREAIICTQQIPENPREDRGVYTICSPTPSQPGQPTSTPSEATPTPTKSPSQPTATPTPKGIGGGPTSTPQPTATPTGTSSNGGDGDNDNNDGSSGGSSSNSSSESKPESPVVGLSNTSGEGGLLLLAIRSIALVWFIISAKKLFGEYTRLGNQ